MNRSLPNQERIYALNPSFQECISEWSFEDLLISKFNLKRTKKTNQTNNKKTQSTKQTKTQKQSTSKEILTGIKVVLGDE